MSGKRPADFQISQLAPEAPKDPKLMSSNTKATAAQLAGRKIKPLKTRKPLGEGQNQNASQTQNVSPRQLLPPCSTSTSTSESTSAFYNTPPAFDGPSDAPSAAMKGRGKAPQWVHDLALTEEELRSPAPGNDDVDDSDASFLARMEAELEDYEDEEEATKPDSAAVADQQSPGEQDFGCYVRDATNQTFEELAADDRVVRYQRKERFEKWLAERYTWPHDECEHEAGHCIWTHKRCDHADSRCGELGRLDEYFFSRIDKKAAEKAVSQAKDPVPSSTAAADSKQGLTGQNQQVGQAFKFAPPSSTFNFGGSSMPSSNPFAAAAGSAGGNSQANVRDTNPAPPPHKSSSSSLSAPLSAPKGTAVRPKGANGVIPFAMAPPSPSSSASSPVPASSAAPPVPAAKKSAPRPQGANGIIPFNMAPPSSLSPSPAAPSPSVAPSAAPARSRSAGANGTIPFNVAPMLSSLPPSSSSPPAAPRPAQTRRENWIIPFTLAPSPFPASEASPAPEAFAPWREPPATAAAPEEAPRTKRRMVEKRTPPLPGSSVAGPSDEAVWALAAMARLLDSGPGPAEDTMLLEGGPEPPKPESRRSSFSSESCRLSQSSFQTTIATQRAQQRSDQTANANGVIPFQMTPANAFSFGSNPSNAAPKPPSQGGIFGSTPSNPPMFGGVSGSTNAFGAGFGASVPQAQPANPFQTGSQTSFSSPFGGPSAAAQPTGSNPFGISSQTTTASGQNQVASAGGFGSFGASIGSGPFGSVSSGPPSSTPAVTSAPDTAMGESTTAPSFGFAANPTSSAPSTGLFGFSQPASSAPSTGLFGPTQSTAAPSSPGLFGSTKPATSAPSSNLFGATQPTTSAPTTSLFGNPQQTSSAPSTSLFGSPQPATPAPSANLFAPKPAQSPFPSGQQSFPSAPPSTTDAPASIFSSTPQPQGQSMFSGFKPSFTPKAATEAPPTPAEPSGQGNMFANVFNRPSSAPTVAGASTVGMATPNFGAVTGPQIGSGSGHQNPSLTSSTPTTTSGLFSFSHTPAKGTEKATQSDENSPAPSKSVFTFPPQTSSSFPPSSASSTAQPGFSFTPQPSSPSFTSAPQPASIQKPSAFTPKAAPSTEVTSTPKPSANLFSVPPSTPAAPSGITITGPSGTTTPAPTGITTSALAGTTTSTPAGITRTGPTGTTENVVPATPTQPMKTNGVASNASMKKITKEAGEETSASLNSRMNKAFLARLKSMDLSQDWTKAFAAYGRIMARINSEDPQTKLSRAAALRVTGRLNPPNPANKMRSMIGGPSVGSKRGATDSNGQESAKRGRPADGITTTPAAGGSTTASIFQNIVNTPTAPAGLSTPQTEGAGASTIAHQTPVAAPATEPAKTSLFSRATLPANGAAPTLSFLGASKPSKKKGKRKSSDDEGEGSDEEPQMKKAKGGNLGVPALDAGSPFSPSRTPTPSTSGRASVFDDPAAARSLRGDNIFGHLSDSGAEPNKDESDSDDSASGSGDEPTAAQSRAPDLVTDNHSTAGSITPADQDRSASPAVAEAWNELGRSQPAKTAPVQTLGETPKPTGRSLFDRVSYGREGDTSSPAHPQPPVGSLFGSSPSTAPGDHTWKPNSPIKFGGSSVESAPEQRPPVFGLSDGLRAPQGQYSPPRLRSRSASPARNYTSAPHNPTDPAFFSLVRCSPPRFSEGRVSEKARREMSQLHEFGEESLEDESEDEGSLKVEMEGAPETPHPPSDDMEGFLETPSPTSTFGFIPTPQSFPPPPSHFAYNHGTAANHFTGPTPPTPTPSGLLEPPAVHDASYGSRTTTPGMSTDGGDEEEEGRDEQTDLSGIEQEKVGHDVLFEAPRSKLKTLDPGKGNKSWVDEATGALLILRSHETGVVKVLMRTIPGGRVAVNTRVTPQLSFAPSGTRSAMGTLAEPGKLKRVCFVFPDANTAQQFVQAHNESSS